MPRLTLVADRVPDRVTVDDGSVRAYDEAGGPPASSGAKSSGQAGKFLKRVSGTLSEVRSVEAVHLLSKSVISTVCIDVGKEGSTAVAVGGLGRPSAVTPRAARRFLGCWKVRELGGGTGCRGTAYGSGWSVSRRR